MCTHPFTFQHSMVFFSPILPMAGKYNLPSNSVSRRYAPWITHKHKRTPGYFYSVRSHPVICLGYFVCLSRIASYFDNYCSPWERFEEIRQVKQNEMSFGEITHYIHYHHQLSVCQPIVLISLVE